MQIIMSDQETLTLRAKIDEPEKRDAVMREALTFYADDQNWLDQNFPNGDYLSHTFIDKGELARQALSTTPVKGWCRISELEKTVALLTAQVEALKYINWGEHQVPCQPIIDELTRLQALIKKEK